MCVGVCGCVRVCTVSVIGDCMAEHFMSWFVYSIFILAIEGVFVCERVCKLCYECMRICIGLHMSMCVHVYIQC